MTDIVREPNKAPGDFRLFLATDLALVVMVLISGAFDHVPEHEN
jgi:hypothetical protein